MSQSFRQMLADTKRAIKETTADQVRARQEKGDEMVLLDVREPDEVTNGYIPGAVAIPRGFLELRVEQQVPDREKTVVIYCAGGTRSALAAKTLQEMGYTDVVSLAGGFQAWAERGYPSIVPRILSPSQLKRYSRHLLIPEIGMEGQGRMLDAKVLMVGAGGLGSPAALYLAAGGIGTMGIVDSDVVDETNLQRQILHTTASVGTPKTESARKTLNAINPDVKVREYNQRLTAQNIYEILKDYDIVLDGSDNFATKYLVNDACVLQGKPYVHGSIFRFEGQITTCVPKKGPCYRCLFPEPPPHDLAPT